MKKLRLDVDQLEVTTVEMAQGEVGLMASNTTTHCTYQNTCRATVCNWTV